MRQFSADSGESWGEFITDHQITSYIRVTKNCTTSNEVVFFIDIFCDGQLLVGIVKISLIKFVYSEANVHLVLIFL